MKLLAIGYALPHPDIDNYNVLTAPSYFDYDAMFIEPASITRIAGQLLHEAPAFEAFDGRPVINAPTTASTVSAAEQILRRREETQRLLERGGVVLVMAVPNATQGGIAGFEGCDRYGWLPAPEGVAWTTPAIRPADGTSIRIVDDDHPCAGLVREFRRQLTYRAVFDDRQPGVRQAGRVFAETAGGLPVGMTFPVSGGLVIFLPALKDEAGMFRSEVAQAIVDAASRLLARASEGEPPYWAHGFGLPGLAEAEKDLAGARDALERATEDLASARARYDDIAGYLRMLWDDGRGFSDAVRRALVLLGFGDRSEPGAPLEVEADGIRALVEAESARGEVVEWPYIRLQRRLEERLLKRGEQLKGIVVVSGHRLTMPEERDRQFTDALGNACANYRYTLLTTETLLAMVERALKGGDAETLERFRRRVIRGAGFLSKEAALGEAGEDAGTFF